MDKPVGYTKHQLDKVKVIITQLVITCRQCNSAWKVDPKDGRMPYHFWECPEGCNSELENEKGE